jgi:dTDP-4-dehydrorhamnose 3,5-epimerase
MKVIPTSIPDVLLFEPQVFADARGFFLESWNARKFSEAVGAQISFVQDNHSRSRRGIVRGMHFQPGMAKHIRCVRGAILDVLVDIRRGSPAFGQWEGFELSDANHHQLYCPNGFAHGFCVLSESADFFYKCTDYYAPETERGIAWNDPSLAIPWPVSEPLLSAKDRGAPRLEDAPLLPTYSR